MSYIESSRAAFKAAPAWFRGTGFLVLMLIMFAMLGILAFPFPGLSGPVAMSIVAIALGLLATRWVTGGGEAQAATGTVLVSGSLGRFALGAGIGIGLWLVHISVMVFVGGGLSFERVPEISLAWAGFALLLMWSLSAMEEVAFRGYALTTLRDAYGVWPAVAITTTAFIGYHILGGQDWVSSVVGTGLGGLVFAMAALASRGLALPIALHGSFNFMTWAAGDKPRYGEGLYRAVIEEGALERIQGVGAFSYITVLSLAALGFYLAYRVRRRVAVTGELH